uniref:coiled-coil domain-containing protein 110-like n=1 Tax=Pristiophorus japonicus TaxID=55135 RepID=UPI00398E38CC
MPVSVLKELPLGNTSLQRKSNQTDYKTSFQVRGSSSAYHSAPLSSITNVNSSPIQRAVVGHTGSDVLLLQYNDENGAILEKICIASEQLRQQLKKSHEWELILGCELQRLRNAANIRKKATGAVSTQIPQKISLSIESLNAEIEVDNKSEKILELEAMVDRLQNAMLSLEESNLDLHRELKKGGGSNSPRQINHWTTTKNKTVIQNNLKNQKEEKTNDITTLQENPENCSHNELILQPSERTSLICHMEKQKEYHYTMHQTMQLVEEKKNKVNALADERATLFPLLQTSENGNNMLNVLRFENEKLDVLSTAKELNTNCDSVLQENVEYKSIVSQLEDERRTLQVQFIEMEEKRKTCIEEFKTLLSKHEDLQLQNQALIADKEQLIIEKESIKRLVDKMTEEKEDLLVVLGAKETVLQLEKTQEAIEVVNANALQLENRKMNESLNELKKEIAFLKNELDKASCDIQCTKAKYAVMRTKNLMLLQLVQEVKDKNYNLETSLQNSVTTSMSLQKEVDEVKIEKAAMKKRYLNEIERAKQVKISTTNCPSDLVRKCEMLSKVVAMLTEENQILNQDLEKYLRTDLQLECNVRKLDEEWLLLGKHTGYTEQEVNSLHPEVGNMRTSYLSGGGNTAAQLYSQRREDKMSDNQLSLSDISFNGTNLSVGDDSRQIHRIPLCSSPKEITNGKENSTVVGDSKLWKYRDKDFFETVCLLVANIELDAIYKLFNFDNYVI